jgi:excisionase family DNA binding protein
MVELLGERSYSTHEISRMLSVDRTTVVRWIERGLIPAYRTPGKHRRVRRSDLIRFVATQNLDVPELLSSTVLIVSSSGNHTQRLSRAVKAGFPAHSVVESDSGLDALVKVGRHQPAVLVLDLGLTDVDVDALCRRARESAGERDMHIVALQPMTGEGPGTARKPVGACWDQVLPLDVAEAALVKSLRPHLPGGQQAGRRLRSPS